MPCMTGKNAFQRCSTRSTLHNGKSSWRCTGSLRTKQVRRGARESGVQAGEGHLAGKMEFVNLAAGRELNL